MIMNVPLQVIRKHQTEAPVDFNGIVRDLGIDVYEWDAPDPRLFAVMWRRGVEVPGNPARWQIAVRAGLAESIQLVRAAHLLAHWILHRHKLPSGSIVTEGEDFRSPFFSHEEELEAMRLTANILLPPALLQEAIRAGIVTDSALAEHFGVPEVFLRRFRDLWELEGVISPRRGTLA